MSLLSITDLCISVEEKEIVHNFSFQAEKGEVHAIMGPNGSGKSTLVNALAGHPAYEVTSGSVTLQGTDILGMEPHERAQAGLFLAFQYPKEIAGVSFRNFLFAAHKAQRKRYPKEEHIESPIKFQKYLEQKMKELHMDPTLAERSVNQGFSGGEKKKAEVLQLAVLKPTLALLDETDSGLDIDALKIVAEGINSLRSPEFTAILVTHYARILEHVTPDHVHVMVDGQIRESGGKELAKRLEEEGYSKFTKGDEAE
jgi:Fe-S cluster assembly ATP-binding protein